ncbi:FtsK/SpoIIIE domain-containing protein [Corynebacterium freiburgense]|uniref:FtsK/SpoIIIE domain-containing protein n=1 Tax=Corynebacterium freiburgense TaxID=556548 RepID=UPI00047EFC13|nr:FtsK/SpoIIIE domain-containing protein [Corynebacterium freiburgense]WJZ03078.1 DNA translocase SftA [Corynebacterium freiburgense]
MMNDASIESKAIAFRETYKNKCLEIEKLSKTLEYLKQQQLSNQRAIISSSRDAANRKLATLLSAHEESCNKERSELIQHVRGLAEKIAPGALSARWEDPVWLSAPDPELIPWAVSIGSIKIGKQQIPVLLPLVKFGYIEFNGEEAEFWRLQLEICLRILGSIGPHKINIFSWDPNFKSLLGVLQPLGKILSNSCNKSAATRVELEEMLNELRSVVRDDTDRIRSKGYFTYTDALLEGFNEAGITLLFLGADLPKETDIDGLLNIAADTNLLVISRSVHISTNIQNKLELDINNGRMSLTGIAIDADRGSVLQGEALRTLVDQMVLHEQHKKLPKLSLIDLLYGSDIEQWVDSGDEGVSAVIARNSDQTVSVNLRSSNPPTPNCLIGGAVGQGKTNLLLTLIHSLAFNYSPLDLQFIILDLKDGVEFNCLGPNSTGIAWLPHLKSLGLSFDIDYAVSVLEWVSQELERRNRIFRTEGVSSFNAYRASCSGEYLPRYVLIIDEFHRIFETGDQRSAKAATLLEHLSRTGRSAGLNIVLSSQSISGITELGAKSSVIFSQFHTRISLKNTREESLSILGPGNYAASELTHPGEIVFNDDLGTVSRNIRAQSAYASSEELVDLRRQLWQQGAGPKPLIFDASVDAEWPNEKVNDIVVGRFATLENDVAKINLGEGNKGIGLIGGDRTSCASSLASILLSSLETFKNPPAITILNGLTRTDPIGAWLGTVVEILEENRASVTLISPEEILSWLSYDTASDIVVALQVNEIPQMSEQINFSSGNDAFGKKIQQILRDSTLFVGWWNSISAAQQNAFDYSKLFKFAVLCGESKDDRSALCGPMYPASIGHRRSTLVQVGAPQTAQRVVPFSFESMKVNEYVEMRQM